MLRKRGAQSGERACRSRCGCGRRRSRRPAGRRGSDGGRSMRRRRSARLRNERAIQATRTRSSIVALRSDAVAEQPEVVRVLRFARCDAGPSTSLTRSCRGFGSRRQRVALTARASVTTSAGGIEVVVPRTISPGCRRRRAAVGELGQEVARSTRTSVSRGAGAAGAVPIDPHRGQADPLGRPMIVEERLRDVEQLPRSTPIEPTSASSRSKFGGVGLVRPDVLGGEDQVEGHAQPTAGRRTTPGRRWTG